jgi:two-component system response regulator PilR (NtrC family)
MNTDRQSTIARVLVVDDEQDILELLELALVRMGLQVERATNVREALRQLGSKSFNLCLTDIRLPDGDGLEVVRYIAAHHASVPVAVITAHGNMENAVSVLKAGAFDYLSKPVALEQLRTLVKAALKLPQPTVAVRDGVRTLLGRSPVMEKVRDLIERVARSQAPVHISGESGSGKELAARLIVEKSARRDQPFVAVNCGAIPETLMESEFFGYRKGAFTGAEKDRDGFFQAANGGTLFLDEVADLPLSMQVKLLRVIQEKKVRKVGAIQEEVVDVRIISATHHALAERVQQDKFRQDLYYRLNVINLPMPPLREMLDDVEEVASQLLVRLRNDEAVEFSPAALQALSQYDYPGNVRELENLIERALALCSDGIITPADLQLAPAIGYATNKPNTSSTARITDKPDTDCKYPLTDYLDRVEREAILEALNQTGFNRTAAAKVLGVTFRALRYRMGRLGITGDDE